MERGDRVRELNLVVGVSSDDPDEVARLRRLAEERFVRGVLEAIERVVKDALGTDALIYVRRIDVRWQVGADELDDDAIHRKLGAELGEALLAFIDGTPRPERLLPRPDAEVAAFSSEAHYRAAYFAAMSRGAERAWFFASLADEPDVWTATLARGPALLAAVLEHWVAMDAVERVIAKLPAGAVEAIEGVLPRSAWPTPVARALAASARGGARRALRPTLVGDGDQPPFGRSRSSDRRAGRGGSSERGGGPDSGHHPGDDGRRGPPGASRELGGREPPETRARYATGLSDSVQTDTERPDLRGEVIPDALEAPEHPSAAGGAGEPDGLEPDGLEADTFAPDLADVTGWAGVFYLARLVLELDLGAHLYDAGVIEGRYLAHAFALLVAEDDPAPWYFGLADPRPRPLEPIAAWAAEEVWTKTRGTFGAVLRARGLPCPLDDELADAVDAHTEALITRGTAAGHDARTAESLARSVVLLAWLFEARLGAPCDLEAFRARVQLPGRLRDDGERLVVSMPMGAIDLDVRRAGLDFDPGWLPWLKRKLAIEFGSDDE